MSEKVILEEKSDISGKQAMLSIDRSNSLQKIAYALSAPLRLEVVRALGSSTMSVGELAKALDQPMSSVALAVRILEEAGVIQVYTRPGAHGSLKICSRRLDQISINLVPAEAEHHVQPLVLRMPIGGYSAAEGITPTCGILNETHALGPLDIVSTFYVPERFNAQLLWFRSGYLEYRFASTERLTNEKISYLELSFEACSEAPMYRDPWPSDIFVEVNGKLLGTWTCPCDCGGRQGHLTPQWWGLANTQYGFLKTWRIDHEGTCLDRVPISGVTLKDLDLGNLPYISVRIGVDPNGENVNGINLFGEKFGDHPQNIHLCVGFA